MDYPKKTWNKSVKPYQEDVTAKGRSFQPGSVRHPSSIAQASHIVDTQQKDCHMAGENSWEEIINGRCWGSPDRGQLDFHLHHLSHDPKDQNGPATISVRTIIGSEQKYWLICGQLFGSAFFRIWSVLAGLSGQNFCGIIPIKQGDEEPQSQASGWNCAIFHQPVL